MKNNPLKRLLAMALCVCMLVSLYVPSVGAVTVSYDEMSFAQILASQENLTWVVCGDSITHNGGWSQGTNSYGEWIEQYLRDIGRTDSVVLSGVGGATLQDLQPNATTRNGISVGTDDFITKFNPDVVTIKLGMNNRPAGEADFKRMYNAMLDEVYRVAAANGKKPKVVILTSTPVAGENTYDLDVPGQDSVNRQVAWLNSIAANYNAQNGTHIQVVDLRNAFTNERLVLGDDYYQTFFYGPSDGAIHPNAAGQYLIFKTIAKSLGFYNASMPIFNHNYQDLNEGYMYVDSTYISDYRGSYGAATDADGDEMDKTMPDLEKNDQPVLLAAADFTEANGKFGADEGEKRYVDLMNDDAMTDKLTGEEVLSMGKEYSVVFRARLENSDFDFKNHSVALYMSANKESKWGGTSTLMVSFPGQHATNGYYGDKNMASGSGVKYGNVRTAAMDGKWHTFAVVQSETKLVMYVDGVAYDLNANYYLQQAIGTYFASAVEAGTFEALFGSYGSGSNADAAYGMDGWVDYVQLYNGALDADEIAHLASNGGNVDAVQMNKTMPTLDDVSTVTSIEFTSTTGSFDGANTNLVDLTNGDVAADPMTFAEAQALSKNFSVVLRARLEKGGNANAGILLVSDNGTAKWNDALTVGIPSQNNQGWLRLMDGGSQKVDPNGQYNFSGATPAGDGEWHTLVIAVSDTTYNYYLDGTLVDTRTLTFTAGVGDVMTNEGSFAARFGRYSDGDGGSYTLKGVLDYFQFYGQTLTAEQAATLSNASVVTDAEEMNATMPKLPAVEHVPNLLASVDFTSENGEFTYNNTNINASTLDLTVEADGVDTLTVAEARTMSKEYTVVFRAKLDPYPGRANQPILYLAGTSTGGFSAQADKLLMGMPGKTNLYYQAYKDSKSVATLSGATTNYGSLLTDMNDGKWHTIAIVQSATGLTYYVDGTAYPVTNASGAAVTLSANIGEMFADTAEKDFDAVIGRYGITDTNWKTQGDFDYWQLYDGVLSASQIKTLTAASGEAANSDAAEWSDMDTDNANWAIAGGAQMIGYQGSVGNRSLLRLIENTARNGSGWINRDIHIIPFASAGYDPEYMVDNYDAIFGGHDYNVFMLLPEVPDVYASGYVHSADLVAAYKEDIKTLMANNTDKVKVLWSPLASNNDTINAYITAYAEAVRQIASENDSILFFDANKFMNERMAANYSLKTNWFEEGMNISPLCALDVTCAFYAHANVASLLVSQEMKDHNLRLSSDNRPLKDTVRDYIVPGVSVSGSSITVDASNILASYSGLTNLRVAVLSATGVGSDHEGNWEDIAYFGSNSSVTFTAPWGNPVVTVLGDMNGYTYRFKDVSTAATGAGLTVEHYTDGLTGLEVVGAPAIGFDADTTSYNIELYQYQRNVQVRAQGGDNLSITVNGEAVEAGALSQQIAVDETATVTVKVTGGAADKTYTLNLTRPDSPDIIITEVMQSTSGALYDMVEIYNASGEELNLLDYALGYKKDYTDSVYTTQNMGKYPYYFTGDDQAFNSRNGSTQTYTGINAITKNSTFWSGENVVEEPDYIPFPADSTMILWVKYNGASATYETLISTLEGSATTYTLEDGTKIVPTADIVALAERPNGVSTNGAVQTGYGVLPPAVTNFYLDDYNTLAANSDNSSRGWVFILKAGAVRDDNVSITEAGDDIISASMLVRPTNSVDMSTVLYYDTDRGMALARNPVSYNATESGAPYYSSEYSYANYTTFGAVEYWQKPYDLADATAAVISNQTPEGVISGEDAQIKLNITDNEDIRYIELYVDADNDGTYETVVKKDLVLIASASNEGLATDIKEYTYTMDLTDLTNTVNYYGFVLDGNNNKTEIGTAEAPKTIEIVEPNQLKITMTVKDVTGAETTEEVKVDIELLKGSSPSNLASSYAVKNSKGETVGTITNGTGTVSVASGDYLTIDNLPAGAVYKVSVTVPEGYEDLTDANAYAGNIGFDGVVNVILQEKLVTSDLTVNASVKKEDGTSAGETTASVVITLNKGESPVDLAESYEVVYGSENKTAVTANGSVTVNLADGETAVVKGLPKGAQYTVTVTAPEGYEDVTTGATTGNVAATGASVNVAVKKILVTADLTVGVTVKKVDGSAAAEDVKATVKIDLTKGNAPVDLETAYDVVDKDGNVLGTTADAVALSNGQKVYVKDLPVGTAYTVSVTAPEGYEDVTDAVNSGNVDADGAIAAVAVQEKLVTGELKVTMAVSDPSGNAADSSVKATVKIALTQGDSPVALAESYDVLNGKGVKIGTVENGTATVTLTNGDSAVIEGLPAGTAYTVTVTAPEGYEDKTTGETTGKVSKDGSTVALAVQEKVKEGELYVSASVKKVDGTTAGTGVKATVTITLTKANAPVDLAESYDILDEDGSKIGTVENGTATVSLSDGQKAVIKGLPEGASYSVSVTAPTGYENKTDASTIVGLIGTDTGAVACVVEEILKTGELEISADIKTTEGETAEDVEASVTITLTKGLSPVALAESYDIVDQDGNKIGTITNGTATIKLAAGEKAVIKGLPQGAAYVVSVTAPEGYENTTTGSTSGNISDVTGKVSLTVTEKEPEPSEDPSEDPTEDPSEPNPPAVTPGTGDNSRVGLYLAVMLVSAVLICLAGYLLVIGRYKPKYGKRSK